MRGRLEKSLGLISYVSTEDCIPADHPPRTIRPIVDEVLATMGRPSIPPEHLMAALILQAL